MNYSKLALAVLWRAVAPGSRMSAVVLAALGGQEVIGWLDTAEFELTGDAAKAQHWAPFVLDTEGDGKRRGRDG